MCPRRVPRTDGHDPSNIREEAYRRRHWLSPTPATLGGRLAYTRILIPEQDDRVLSYGVGLTDIAKGVAASTDSKLRAGDFDIATFLKKIERYQPRCVAFNGKGTAGRVAKYAGHQKPDHGPTSFEIAGAAGYVLPSSSAANNDPARFKPKLTKAAWWQDFGSWLRES